MGAQQTAGISLEDSHLCVEMPPLLGKGGHGTVVCKPRVEASLYGYCRSKEVNSKCIRGVQGGAEMET